ncbi:CHASE domain-containing sensor histidine kinase [Marinomonas fungiae]|uniref:histidine kinase n=1 Tax=Marinomonas fungiae TaxID=1137284 RepID=A0A0K6IUD1_9GAMM|nr:CHASE domain-containing protein [Marinomonas fungiae]CUB06693.1 His Kinase A (phospho-acceptor) domain/Histidine kinase-, DNA gyrase B-, and HSP90-like ATPase/CHASE domain [Marinomonas fungiae]
MTASDQSASQELRFPKGLHWYHWAVIFLSLMLTLGAFYISEKQIQLKMASQFEFQSQQIIELVKERMVRYEEALRAGTAALKMLPTAARRQDWREFELSLDLDERFPGINGIGVIHYVPPNKLPTYLAWQRETMPAYQIHPKHDQAEYWPITYIEPQNTNLKAVGLDIAHENNRYTAAMKARDTGEASITAPITLVQDDKKTPGFLFYVPWYDTANYAEFGSVESDFMGLVYAPFIINKLMDGTLENANRLINFSIHDEETLLYTELNSDSSDLDPDPLFMRTETLELYGRPWRFDLQTTAVFRNQQSHIQPYTILICGLIIDSLLLSIFIISTRSNRRAVEYANHVTERLKQRNDELETVSASLKEKNKGLEEANAELDQFAFVASHDLKAPLRGIQQLATWIEEDSEELLPDDTKGHLTLMKSRIARLERLLDDLLAYSRVGRKDGDRTIIRPKDLTLDIFNMLNHDGKFELSENMDNREIEIFSTPFELVMRNLISNSMKHHDKAKGQIKISMTVDSGRASIEVSDDGPGIPEEHQQKVFELFHTLKPRDKVEGSGLGLSLIKKILDRYGCEYSLKNNNDGGLSFFFTWPVELINKEEQNENGQPINQSHR